MKIGILLLCSLFNLSSISLGENTRNSRARENREKFLMLGLPSPEYNIKKKFSVRNLRKFADNWKSDNGFPPDFGIHSHSRFPRSPLTNSSKNPNSGNPNLITKGNEPLPLSSIPVAKRRKEKRSRRRQRNDISLWIDENQVRLFSGYNMEIYAIMDGRVMSYILDPDFEDQLPLIPSEVETVNFTWRSPKKKYFYHFDLLSSFDQEILQTPLVSVRKRGRVPRKPKVFSVRIPCAGNASGVAGFGIGLKIENVQGEALAGTPLRLRLKKHCELEVGPDPECDKKCSNGGECDESRRCLCPNGYMGQFCNVALCYPQCRNGGTCSAPGRCTCPFGYHGRVCEGGICRNNCLNGGKCVQKDTCKCSKGFYGNRCEFSRCIVSV